MGALSVATDRWHPGDHLAVHARLVDVLSAAVVATVVLLPVPGLLRMPGAPMEEGFMLVLPELILEGWVPHRDVLHLYGPGGLWTLAAVFAATEPSLLAERLVGLAQHVLLVAAVHQLARAQGRVTAALAAVTSAVLTVPLMGLTALAWTGALALLLWAAVLGLRARHAAPSQAAHRLGWAAGALAGAALLYRPDLVVAVGLVGVVLARGAPWALVGRLLGGLAAGTSPYLVHAAVAGWGNVVRGLFVEPVLLLRGGRSLPLPPSPTRLQGHFEQALTLEPSPWPLPAPGPAAQVAVWFVLLLLAIALLVATAVVLARREAGSARARTVAVVAAVSIGILPQALQRADASHLGWVTCVPLALLPLATALHRGRRHSRRPPLGRWAPVATLAGVVLLLPTFTAEPWTEAVATTVGRRAGGHAVTHAGRTFVHGDRQSAAAVEAVLAEVELLTEPGDRILVGPADLRRTAYTDSYLYHLLPHLEPATSFVQVEPGITNRAGSGFAADLASADVVVLSRAWDHWREPNRSAELGSDEPSRLLAERFCLRSVHIETYEVYEQC